MEIRIIPEANYYCEEVDYHEQQIYVDYQHERPIFTYYSAFWGQLSLEPVRGYVIFGTNKKLLHLYAEEFAQWAIENLETNANLDLPEKEWQDIGLSMFDIANYKDKQLSSLFVDYVESNFPGNHNVSEFVKGLKNYLKRILYRYILET